MFHNQRKNDDSVWQNVPHHEAHEGHERFGSLFDKNFLNFVIFVPSW